MSDEPDLGRPEPGPDEGRDQRPGAGHDEADAHIRELLAELGSGPDGAGMPPEVAARLDTTLARLVAEREAGAPMPEHADESRSGSVVPLRRRWLPRATAAAAAVIVVGAGGVAASNLGLFGNAASTSSDGAGEAQVAESAPEPTAPSTASKSLTDQDSDRAATGGARALPQVSAGSFASDVASLLQRRPAADSAEEAPTPGPSAGEDLSGDSPERTAPDLATPEEARQSPGTAFRSTDCPGPAVTDGAVPNLIRYDEQLAVLVIHPEKGGRQLVEAWNCPGDRRLAETTVTP